MDGCFVCKKGPEDNVSLFRVNEKGVKGIWACREHYPQSDAPPIDPEVDDIVSIIEKDPFL